MTGTWCIFFFFICSFEPKLCIHAGPIADSLGQRFSRRVLVKGG